MKTLKLKIAAVFAALSLAGCTAATEALAAEKSLFAMNTYMTFTAYGEDAEKALEESAALIENLEALWSVTDQKSDIYRANHSGGQTVTVSAETAELVDFSLMMAGKTGGALDPTIYPVLLSWGFTTDSKQVPPSDQISKLLENVSYDKIKLEGNSLTVPDGMQIDMGAVGKGYTADLVTEKLKQHKIQSAIISLGGNVQAIGSRPDGTDWHIGVRAPWEDGNIGVLQIRDAAVVTSGGYENYFEDENGDIYWHIIDPSTGYPAKSGLQSVTVVGKEGRLCDALSTSLFVMGEEKAVNYWRENGGFDMLLITDQNEIAVTPGIAERFTLNDGRKETVRVIEQK